MKRLIVIIVVLLLALLYTGSVAAYEITTDGAVLFDNVEISSSDGQVNYDGNGTLILGDGVDDAVLIKTGTGDGLAITVNNGTPAMTVQSSGDITVNNKLDMGTLSIGGTAVTATGTELSYVNGVTSGIQGQLNGKQPTITGGASTITSANLASNRALVSDGSGKVAASSVTATELGYVVGVTSGIQSQLNNLGSNDFWARSAGGDLYPLTLSDWIGIGTNTPTTQLEVYDQGVSTIPMVLLHKYDPSVAPPTGDASLEFRTIDGAGISLSYTAGIDNDDGDVFKVSDVSGHQAADAGIYTGRNTMLRIHPAAVSPIGQGGITDINHQSRARWFLGQPQSIPSGIWTAIEFDQPTYDEHAESTPGAPGTPWSFKATQEGYYQVNARTGFDLRDVTGLQGAGWVSIAIFVNRQPYAQGNTLDVTYVSPVPVYLLLPEGGDDPIYGPAPNVSDVLYLQKGDVVEIYAGHTLGVPVPLEILHYKTYVSIHKVS